MADRSYLGGKNNIAQFHHKLDCRKENKIVIDVDISAAYCRAFGCIPAVNFKNRFKNYVTPGKYSLDYAKQYNEELHYTKIGFFDTKFKFDKKLFEPCLPQKMK
jgi:hypothetical protein